MGSKTDSVIRDAVYVSYGVYVSQFLSFFAALAMRRMLGPYYAGIWNALMIFFMFSGYTHLGILMGTERELPFYLSRGEDDQVRKIESTTFSVVMAGAVLSLIGIVVLSFILTEKYPPEGLKALRFLSVGIALQLVQSYYLVVYLRSRKNFDIQGKMTVYMAVLMLVSTVTGIYFLGIYAIAVVSLVQFGFAIAYVHVKLKCKLRFGFDVREFKRLFFIGLPLIIRTYLGFFSRNLDKIEVARILGAKALGIYGIGMMATNFLFNLPNSLAVVLYPRFQEQFSRRLKIEDMRKIVVVPMTILNYLFPLIIAAAYLVAPLLITYVIPKFSPGINAMRIQILASFFITMSYFPNYLIITISRPDSSHVSRLSRWLASNRQYIPVLNSIILILLYRWALNFFLHGYPSIETAAVIFLAINAVGAITLSLICLKYLFGFLPNLLFTLKQMIPFGYMVLVVNFSDYLLPYTATSLLNDVAFFLAKCLLTLMLFAPVLVYLERKYGVLGEIVAFVVKRYKRGRR